MKAVTSSKHIEVSATALWLAITSEHHLEACHPYILRHTKNTSHNGLSDEIIYLNGVTYTRESTAWLDGVGYDLRVGIANGLKNEVTWRIGPVTPDSCKLSISVTPLAIAKLPKSFRGLALRLLCGARWGIISMPLREESKSG